MPFNISGKSQLNYTTFVLEVHCTRYDLCYFVVMFSAKCETSHLIEIEYNLHGIICTQIYPILLRGV